MKRTGAGPSLIRARDVRKAYGGESVLEGLDLDLAPGERVALLGPNGAGKTTLFRCLLGTVAFRGRIEVDGIPVGPAGSEARRRIGYVPQTPPPFDLRLAEFLDFFAGLRGVPPRRARERLEGLGLDPGREGGKRMRELSGGMRQKAVLALALASEAPLLLLDEPTSSLDPRSRRELLRAVKGVEAGRAVLFASHRFDEIEFLAGRVLVLHRSRIVFDGTPAGLWSEAGLGPRLWLRVPGERVAEVSARLRERDEVEAVRANGAGIEVEVRPARELDLLAELRTAGEPVLEFRSRPPAPDEMLDRILSRQDSRRSDPPPAPSR